MISYQNRTFCTAQDCVKHSTCERFLTPEIKAAAQAARLPLAHFANPHFLPCFEHGKNSELQFFKPDMNDYRDRDPNFNND